MTGTGLLIAMMEPPASLEEEFQDWYDTEHFPERHACAGFLTAQRFVCVDGWPRYLAMYDLDDVEVLRGEAYRRIAHTRYSPWTHRIIAKVWGQYRAEGVQVHPGSALHGKAGVSSRLAVLRFRGVASEIALVSALQQLYEQRSQTVQLRVFRVAPNESGDYLAMVELRGASAQPDVGTLQPAALRHLDMINSYVPYVRQAPAAFPKS
jgi:hypothetical protein